MKNYLIVALAIILLSSLQKVLHVENSMLSYMKKSLFLSS